MSNLTKLQESLINGLKKEFSRINPQVSNSGGKRFGIDTIGECKNEEAKFLETVRKHNLTMIKVFDKQFKDELKAFEKEFGKVFKVQLGHTYSNNEHHHGYDNLIKISKNSAQSNSGYNEIHLHIVGKKPHSGDSRFNYCNGKDYTKIFVDFNRESVTMTLESGKQVSAYKIKGLVFSEREYLYRSKSDNLATATLDEFIQTSKSLQKRLVEIS